MRHVLTRFPKLEFEMTIQEKKGNNIRYRVVHRTCGQIFSRWSSAIYEEMTCPVCSKATNGTFSLTEAIRPRRAKWLLVNAGFIQSYHERPEIPPGTMLFKERDLNIWLRVEPANGQQSVSPIPTGLIGPVASDQASALPTPPPPPPAPPVDDFAAHRVTSVPNPDGRFRQFIAVPQEYASYIANLSDISPFLEDSANELYDSIHGSHNCHDMVLGIDWLYEGKRYQYIYPPNKETRVYPPTGLGGSPLEHEFKPDVIKLNPSEIEAAMAAQRASILEMEAEARNKARIRADIPGL